MRPLAVIETVTGIEELQHLLAGEIHLAAFRLEKCAESPQGYSWFNVCVDGSDPLNAMRTVRSVLHSLLDGADRGLVEHFRIVIGADLLRHPDRSGGKSENSSGGPCLA
jgi:hypothetical protein